MQGLKTKLAGLKTRVASLQTKMQGFQYQGCRVSRAALQGCRHVCKVWGPELQVGGIDFQDWRQKCKAWGPGLQRLVTGLEGCRQECKAWGSGLQDWGPGLQGWRQEWKAWGSGCKFEGQGYRVGDKNGRLEDQCCRFAGQSYKIWSPQLQGFFLFNIDYEDGDPRLHSYQARDTWLQTITANHDWTICQLVIQCWQTPIARYSMWYVNKSQHIPLKLKQLINKQCWQKYILIVFKVKYMFMLIW